MRFSCAALLAAIACGPATNAFVPSSLQRQQRPELRLGSTTEDDVSKFILDEKFLSSFNGKSPVNPAGDSSSNTTPLNHSTPEIVRDHTLNYLNENYVGQNGASIVYSLLQKHGVTVVNGFSGGAVLPLLDQFSLDHPRHSQPGAPTPIRWITNSNEASAGHVAEGYAKAFPLENTNKPLGVVVATSGPGVTNLITPLQDGLCDGVPLLVLCGQAATTAPPDAFQSSPAVDLTRPCTKWSYQVRSAAEIPLAMEYAIYVATHGRPGPVFVDLPKDLQNQVVTREMLEEMVDAALLSSSDSAEGFLRLKENYRWNGQKMHALHMGYAHQGLPFEIVQGKDDVLDIAPVSYSKANDDPYHADHHPTNTVHRGDGTVSPFSPEDPTTASLVQLMRRAKKPVIIAGQGCNDAAPELLKLAETLQIPVTTTLHALGCFDERHPLALNMVGMHGHPTPNYMVQEADLILCVGSRFDDRITGRMADFVPEARKAAAEGRGGIVHVDIRKTEYKKQVEPTFFVHSTGKNFLSTVNGMLSAAGSSPTTTEDWLAHMRQLQTDFPVKIPHFPTESKTDPTDGITHTHTKLSAQSVITELNRQLLEANRMDDVVFTTGVGVHQMVAAQLITWTQPRQMLSSGSLGTMGVALGYSIGAQLANDGTLHQRKIVIAVDGDGSFNMTFTELKTLMEEKIPVKILLLDNEGQMMVEYWQRLFHDNRLLAVRNGHNPAYTKLAEAFGIKSLYCDRQEDVESVLREFLFRDVDEPVLLHMRIERTPCLPLVAPGQPLEDMILEDVEVEVDPGAAPS